jgi:hypothetical protein
MRLRMAVQAVLAEHVWRSGNAGQAIRISRNARVAFL